MLFPLYLELDGRPCLVVGNGPVARRKASALTACGARVTLVSPETCGRTFAESDVEGMALVVAATNDPEVNARVSAVCRGRGIPVNVVDDPANCTFHFPAVFRKGPLTVAVSSGGACPVAAQIVRRKAGDLLSDAFVDEVERLGRERAELKVRYPDPMERRKFCEERLKEWNG